MNNGLCCAGANGGEYNKQRAEEANKHAEQYFSVRFFFEKKYRRKIKQNWAGRTNEEAIYTCSFGEGKEKETNMKKHPDYCGDYKMHPVFSGKLVKFFGFYKRKKEERGAKKTDKAERKWRNILEGIFKDGRRGAPNNIRNN